MKKGKQYIVFLSPSNLDKIPMVISASNGLVDISNLSQNEKVEVAYKSAIDFLSDSIPQKAKDVIINSKSAKSIVDYITKQSLR